jgi:outer membrane protein OmpA-like peptidoglycan-associated protein
MRVASTLLVATALALPLAPSAALAQGQPPAGRGPVAGVYLGGAFSFTFPQDSDIDATGALSDAARAAGANPGGDVRFNPGIGGVLALGWGFGNGLRAEVEGSYRRNDVDSISGFNGLGPLTGVGGDRSLYGVMANVMYDMTIFGAVQPFIGAGLGYLWSDWSGVRATAASAGLRLTVDDTDGQFAYQGIAGLAFPIDRVPGLRLTAEYRFIGTLSPRLETRVQSVATGATVATGRIEADNYNHSVLLGVRYAFGAAAPAAPPPAPAAVPAPVRSYLVFFDFDRADLTDRARQIIGEAAQGARRGQSTRIDVTGHTDRAGSAQHNQALSLRRAEAVAGELVRQGIARADIAIRGEGESSPMIATADGVREPQNRRVEIVLR